MRQILSGLNYLHFEKKILHRDLKLENILLHYEDEEDRLNKRIMKAKVKIIDFGFARYLYSNYAKSILGSPIYMDPKILLKYNKLYNYYFLSINNGRSSFWCKKFKRISWKD